MQLCRDPDVFDDFAGSPSSAAERHVAKTALVRPQRPAHRKGRLKISGGPLLDGVISGLLQLLAVHIQTLVAELDF